MKYPVQKTAVKTRVPMIISSSLIFSFFSDYAIYYLEHGKAFFVVSSIIQDKQADPASR